MSTSINFQRFLRVLHYSWQTQPISPYIVLILGIPVMYLTFMADAIAGSAQLYDFSQLPAFIFYFIGCGWLYAGLTFKELNKPETAIRYLHIPASTLEKWLAKFLLVFIVFPAITLLAFQLGVIVFNWLSAPIFTFRYGPFDYFRWELHGVYFFFFLGLPVAFASGLIWKRFGFAKTALSVFVVLVLSYMLNHAVNPYERHITSGEVTIRMNSLFVGITPPFYAEDHLLPDTVRLLRWFWLLGVYIPSLLLLASSYFFMKEKEV